MNSSLKVSQSIEINASPAAIWDTMTNPEKIKVYLFGTETITDWKVDSPIVFQGNYEGHVYKDKGNVLEVTENELLKYNYWSSMSGTEDKIENYFIVTYIVEAIGTNKVKFTWQQEGFPSEEKRQHTAQGLTTMLEHIKKVAEG
ncbi:MAG: SRPBCC domain-containing protein [Flavobacteriales bacterium]|nr:SRPBCC domain-containing protein [Flavobacteriales bacterium]